MAQFILDWNDTTEAMRAAEIAFDSGNYDEAIAVGEQLREVNPTEPRIHLLLGSAEIRRGKPEEAIPCLLKAADLEPQNATAWLLLGDAFEDLEEWESAVEAFLIAVRLASNTSLPHRRLFRLVADGFKGRIVDIGVFDRWVQTFVGGADLQEALWKLDRNFGKNDDQWDRQVFAQLSRVLMFKDRWEEAVEAFSKSTLPVESASADEDRDRQTLRSEYREMVWSYDSNSVARNCAKVLADFAIESTGTRPGIRVLDAACGTGLVGLHLQAWADEIVGIDLSPDMLAEAGKKGVYAKLTLGDISTALKDHGGSFDLVTCAGALYHLPDLSGFFGGATCRLVPGGVLAVSVDPCSDDWEVRTTILGGFAHSRRYLRRLALENGLDEIAIRVLEHRAHPGFYAAFRKKAASGDIRDTSFGTFR